MDELIGQQWVKGTIKGELDKRGMTYADLVRRLAVIGVDENERNLRNKIARGTFSAVFFCQCLEAIGLQDLRLDLVAFVKSQARQQTLGELERDKRADGTIGPVVNLKWWHDKPVADADVMLLPTDEFPDRDGEYDMRCGNCGTPLLRGWSLEEASAQFRNENIIARCETCRRYNALPGTPAARL